MNLKEYIFKQESEFKEYVGKGLDPQKQQQLHDDIVSGKIDIGPMADHSEPVEDKRPGVQNAVRFLPKYMLPPLQEMILPSEIDRNGDLSH